MRERGKHHGPSVCFLLAKNPKVVGASILVFPLPIRSSSYTSAISMVLHRHRQASLAAVGSNETQEKTKVQVKQAKTKHSHTHTRER